MSRRPDLVSYLGAVLGFAAALGMVIRGAVPQAVVLAVGALFLIYWGRRLERERGGR